MDFTFSEDQLLFQATVRDFLVREITPAKIRALWETDTGRSEELWAGLSALGLTGLTVPEEFGGLGMNELDFVLLARECGYVALPEPLVQTVLVAVPLLQAIGGELARRWLPAIAAGAVRVAVGLQRNGLVEDAHVAGLILLQQGDELHALSGADAALRYNESVDPSRRLFAVEVKTPNPVASDPDLVNFAMNRGALGNAAQALGLAQRMIDLSVRYTAERRQFGRPVGSFQAVKHHLADAAVGLAYAAAPVYRAAYAAAHQSPRLAEYVSHAKLAACAAAELAAKNCIQVHGAMGYTWGADLHIFMKKAWALAGSWGDAGFHRARMSRFILADGAPLGAGATFLN